MTDHGGEEVTLADLKAYPGMTRWFDPRLLVKLLSGVIVSSLFSRYADRRLIVAALDKEGPEEAFGKTRLGLTPGPDGAVWIDYVSDIGDGFDSAYAVAFCLGQERLTLEAPATCPRRGEVESAEAAPGEGERPLRGAHVPVTLPSPRPGDGSRGTVELPRASLLVMGGDEVYPTASRDNYNRRLRDPYKFANPRVDGAPTTPVLLIPGNHDWYDGLVSFLALFCRRKPTSLGAWATCQRRSYFAVQLVDDWWLWAVDIALTADMDQPQADYFVAMAERMPVRARIILCSAEPGWYEGDKKSASFRSLDYAAKLADNAGRDFRIVLVLSGDAHHYARYDSRFGTEFITAGGGGAYVEGTHHLPATIKLDWLKLSKAKLKLRAAYPDTDTSRRLLRRNLLFPITNVEFAAALGVVYWVLGSLLTRFPQPGAYLLVALVLVCLFGFYAGYQEREKIAAAALDPEERREPTRLQVAKGRRRIAVLAPAWLQGLVHAGLLAALAHLFAAFNARALGLEPGGLPSVALLLPEMVPTGGLAAGFVFGAFLWLTSRFLDLNHHDAFSALRHDGYRSFLRIRIRGDLLTIFPVGIDRVPRRSEWRIRQPGDAVRSLVVPRIPLRPRLIEPPVTIDGSRVGGALDTVRPEVVAGSEPGPAVVPSDSAGPSPAPPG